MQVATVEATFPMPATKIVEGIYRGLTVGRLPSAAELRAALLAEFTEELDRKLADMVGGEALQHTYRLDIIKPDGTIRDGAAPDRKSEEYAEWRKAVFERDGYRCRECGAKGALNAHHVLPWATYPDSRFEVDNGLTLCEPCHAAAHPGLGFNRGKGAVPKTRPAWWAEVEAFADALAN